MYYSATKSDFKGIRDKSSYHKIINVTNFIILLPKLKASKLVKYKWVNGIQIHRCSDPLWHDKSFPKIAPDFGEISINSNVPSPDVDGRDSHNKSNNTIALHTTTTANCASLVNRLIYIHQRSTILVMNVKRFRDQRVMQKALDYK